MRRDFYTVHLDGLDSDEVERWFAHEFEQPGLEASQRLIDGQRLARDDWHALARFYAAQEVRTPQSFIEAMARLDKSVPEALETALTATVREVESARAEGRELEVDHSLRQVFSGHVKVEIVPSAQSGSDDASLAATVTIGRAFWIETVKNLVAGKAVDKLLRHVWHVLTPAPGFEWPLTDHPTLRVGYRSQADYSFQSGWGQHNADLAMPLSPQHLLHVQVGKKQRGTSEAPLAITREIQRLLVMRAHRQIFATAPLDWLPTYRARAVNKAQFDHERDQWDRWHSEQSVVERLLR